MAKHPVMEWSIAGEVDITAHLYKIIYENLNGDIHTIAYTRTLQDAFGIVRAHNAYEALLEAVRLDVVDGECFCHAGPESAGRYALGLGPGPCDYCVAKQAIALAEGGKDGGA